MLGLGLTSTTHKSRCVFDENGWINDTGAYWTHDIGSGSTSLDDMTSFTIIAHFSYSAHKHLTGGFNLPSIFKAIWDSSNDTGFEFSADSFSKYFHGAGVGRTRFAFKVADGSGAPTTLLNDTEHTTPRWGFQDTFPHGATGCPSLGVALRFKAGATNEMNICQFSNSIIEFTEGNNDVTNTGQISDKIDITFGDAFWTDYTQPTKVTHKFSLWNTALTDTEIMKLMGFNHTTLADVGRSSLDGFYHNVSRFTSYADLSIDTPEHEWDFSSAEPKVWTSGTLSDTGNQSDLDMTATGSPPIGSRGQQL